MNFKIYRKSKYDNDGIVSSFGGGIGNPKLNAVSKNHGNELSSTFLRKKVEE